MLNRPQWERLREKGQIHYILVYGVILFGLGTGLLVSLVQWVQSMPPFHPWPDPLEYLVAGAIVGFLVGHLAWFNNESRYWGGDDR
jgi:drug/metabolite transporter (DMT)-like permease